MTARITEFKGDWSFLSNFSPHEVDYNGITYKTAEHAYQAAARVITTMDAALDTIINRMGLVGR